MTTTYFGDIEYEGNAIKAIYHADGRILKNGSNFDYEYYIKDHLGNTRVVFNSPGVIQSEQHYYPFGLSLEGNFVNTGYYQKYRYNGKELYSGLGWYDYGARWYDPCVGRFTSVDPLAEKYQEWSPYNYVFDNPIKLIDPDGRGPDNPIKELLKSTGAYVAGIANAIASNMVGGAPGTRNNPDSFGENATAAANGQRAGDAISVVVGAGAVVTSFLGVVGETIGTPLTGGATTLAIPTTVAIGAEGSVMMGSGLNNLLNPSRVEANSKNEIPVPGSGKGSVSPSQRDPQRAFSPKQKKEMLQRQNGKCLGCDTKLDPKNAKGHHDIRHADGGKTSTKNGTALCETCHKEIHKIP